MKLLWAWFCFWKRQGNGCLCIFWGRVLVVGSFGLFLSWGFFLKVRKFCLLVWALSNTQASLTGNAIRETQIYTYSNRPPPSSSPNSSKSSHNTSTISPSTHLYSLNRWKNQWLFPVHFIVVLAKVWHLLLSDFFGLFWCCEWWVILCRSGLLLVCGLMLWFYWLGGRLWLGVFSFWSYPFDAIEFSVRLDTLILARLSSIFSL